MRKKFLQKGLTSLNYKDAPLRRKKLDKQFGRRVITKIKNCVFRQRHIQRVVLLAVALIHRISSGLPNRIPRMSLKKFGFGGLSKNFFSPQNLVALLLLDVGVAILVWVGNLLWIDVTVWGKDIALILFGSRAGEAVSLGIGMTVFYHLIIGATLLFTSIALIKSRKIRELDFFMGLPKREKMREALSTSRLMIKSRKIGKPSFRGVTKRGKTFVAVALLAFFVVNMFLLNSIIGQTSTRTSLQSYGSIRTVGVGIYTNKYCTESASAVDWGQITPGESISRRYYLKNEGNSDVMLSLYTTNWTPENAENYMTLTWDYAEQSISANEVISVTLTLTVQQSISGIETFNFDIDIIGAG